MDNIHIYSFPCEKVGFVMTEAATAPAAGQAKQEEEKIQRNPGARPGTNKLKTNKDKQNCSVFFRSIRLVRI